MNSGRREPEFDRVVTNLEESLTRDYQALQINKNPVLLAMRQGTVNGARTAVAQYSLLPCRIVEILGAMAYRLRSWPIVHEELLENIAQECGSLTQGAPHFSILRNCLKRELDVDVNIEPAAETQEFLGGILSGIHNGASPFVAGMAFALEASALPELKVVAALSNEAAHLSGIAHDIVARHQTADRGYAEAILVNKLPGDYSLEDFLVVHLIAIEVEHRDGLKNSIGQCLSSSQDMEKFEKGFKYLLDLMENWWNCLAKVVKYKEVVMNQHAVSNLSK